MFDIDSSVTDKVLGAKGREMLNSMIPASAAEFERAIAHIDEKFEALGDWIKSVEQRLNALEARHGKQQGDQHA